MSKKMKSKTNRTITFSNGTDRRVVLIHTASTFEDIGKKFMELWRKEVLENAENSVQLDGH